MQTLKLLVNKEMFIYLPLLFYAGMYFASLVLCVMHQTHIAGTVLNMYQDKVSM